MGGHPRDRGHSRDNRIRHGRRVGRHATVFSFGAAYLVIDDATRDEVQKHDECEKDGYGRKKGHGRLQFDPKIDEG
ncbi:hypothetical protein [Rhodococcus sp. (in: high G+C Gram-positive bacteria)]|uniref:hypothetical protein n=1 Tax=Rhodococcus sp. TaxID=1831 RepID=UPI00388F0992